MAAALGNSTLNLIEELYTKPHGAGGQESTSLAVFISADVEAQFDPYMLPRG